MWRATTSDRVLFTHRGHLFRLGPIARGCDHTPDRSRPANSNVLSLGDIFPAYTFTNIWPLAGIERRRRTASLGNVRDLPFSAGFPTRFNRWIFVDPIHHFNLTIVPFQEPTIEIVSSVRRARQRMTSEEGHLATTDALLSAQ